MQAPAVPVAPALPRRSRAEQALAAFGSALVLACSAAAAAPAMAAPPPALPPPQSAPYRPTDDAAVLQQVPPASDPAVRLMHQLRTQLDAAPQDTALARRLADAYVAFGRQVGDAHYAGYAEAVLQPWLSQPQPPVPMLNTYADILQYRHEFDAARAQLEGALQRDPGSAQALLTLATLDMVQGRYPEASRRCAELSRSGGGDLGTLCSAALGTYTGKAGRSIELLNYVAGRLPADRTPPTFRAWIEGLLAESCERLGDWAGAEAHYRQALAATPEDNFLLVAYADLLLDQGRPQEVLPLLASHEQSDTAFLRLVLARAALKSPDLPRYVWTMAARFAALRQRGSEYFGREEVRFALHLQHDPAGALELAQANWQQQREPWDVRVLLEAADAAGQPAAAQPVLDFIARSHLQDPTIAALAARLRSRMPAASGASS
jgi:tetratricopeptide (TPR) repeat protein